MFLKGRVIVFVCCYVMGCLVLSEVVIFSMVGLRLVVMSVVFVGSFVVRWWVSMFVLVVILSICVGCSVVVCVVRLSV